MVLRASFFAACLVQVLPAAAQEAPPIEMPYSASLYGDYATESPEDRWRLPSDIQPDGLQPDAHGHRSPYVGSKHIKVCTPCPYHRISALDVDDPDSFFSTLRPNIFGERIPDEWDFCNLIGTDRPDFTDSPFTVGKKVSIIETGYTFRQINTEDTHFTRRQLPESLLRYGLTDEFELRIKWLGYIMTEQADRATGVKETRFGGDDLQLGFKWELLQQEEFRPMITILSGAIVPAGTRDYSANIVQPQFNLILGWGLRRWLYFKTSTGWDYVNAPYRAWMGGGGVPVAGQSFITQRDAQNVYHQSASLLFQASKHVGGYAEWFSFYSSQAEDNRPAHYGNTGIYYYVTPNLQLDIRIGKRLSDRVDEIFTGAGLSVRF